MTVELMFRQGNSLKSFTFDSCKSARGSFETMVTEHPIEGGGVASDTATNKPTTLTLEGIFSDFPLTINGGGLGAPHEKGRSADILETLVRLKSLGVRFSVATSLRVYSQMMIRRIDPDATGIKGAVRLSVSLVEARVVGSETVNVQIAANRSGQRKKIKGKVSTTEAGAPETLKSTAYKVVTGDGVKQVVDSARGLFGL